ncbi:hypothetical protein [Streptomyces antimycoticus]|uniref:hypothetical protein n=1 Tax=Streptomyces antimycoticus TaxID=68175 RepID=UPI0036EE139A
MSANPTLTAPLAPEYEAEIRERVDRLADDRVLTGSTWLASSVGSKSVFPPEQSHVVEDVLEVRHSVIRGSVGVFGVKQHAEFTAHAPDDIAALLDELDRLRAERQETNGKLAELTMALRAAEKRVAELERPAIEARRNAIRDSYREMAAQAREDRDHEGEQGALRRLEQREAEWVAEDAKAGDR